MNEQLNYDHDEKCDSFESHESLFNEEHRSAFDDIIDSVTQKQGHLLFLNDPRGTGKTFVYNMVCHKLQSEGTIVLCVASSSITALLFKGG